MRDKSVMLSRVYFIDNAPLVITCLLIFDSLHFIFARLLLPYLPPVTSAMYVLGIATVEVAFFMVMWDQIRLDVFWHHRWFFLSIGFLVAVSTILSYGSVAYLDPGTASVLGRVSLLFGLAFGLVWLHERLTLLESIGALIALSGVVVITFQPGDYLRLGSLIVMVSALAYAVHAALVKRYSAEIGLTEFFFFRVASTTGFLVLFTAGQGELIWPGWQAWLILLLAGTIDVVISRGLYYLALRRLQLSFHSIILTLSPVATIIWSLFLFNAWPTLQQLLGSLAVLGGIILVTASRSGLLRK